MPVCFFVFVTIIRTVVGENQKCKNNSLIDFDICHLMSSLRKLYSVTLTYFSKVKDWNQDLPTSANALTSVTIAINAILRGAPYTDTRLPTSANIHPFKCDDDRVRVQVC